MAVAHLIALIAVAFFSSFLLPSLREVKVTAVVLTSLPLYLLPLLWLSPLIEEGGLLQQCFLPLHQSWRGGHRLFWASPILGFFSTRLMRVLKVAGFRV